MTTATFRFYEELNDFLPRAQRYQDIPCECARAATTKHMIEALGVPHTEVELILVNGESSSFDRVIQEGDRVAVYPMFEAFDVTSLIRLRDAPMRQIRFIADAHLGGLARFLRLAGFDTLYDNNFKDPEIEAIASREHRTILTRDRELLKRRTITHGCFVRALKPEKQFAEIVERLDLRYSARPFSLCLQCNVPLHAIRKCEIEDLLPPSVRQNHDRFSTCDGCHGVFWEGSHWRRMVELLADIGIGANFQAD